MMRVTPQLLAVTRDQQERIIRAGAKDQDAGNARRRTVESLARPIRDDLGDHRRRAIGHRDHYQRHEPQHRRAIGEDQQERHHRGCDCKQSKVRAVEGRRDVSSEGRAASELNREALGFVLLHGRAQFIDEVGEVETAHLSLDIDHDDHGFAVLSGDRWRDLVSGDVGPALGDLGDPGQVVLSQTPGPLDDGDGREHVTTGEVLHKLRHLSRLGIRGQWIRCRTTGPC